MIFEGEKTVFKLAPERGGYYYFVVEADFIAEMPEGKKTRLVCEIDKHHAFRCGLNHLGDGNFFVIISGKRMKEIGTAEGRKVAVRLDVDPDPLGVEMPDFLAEILAQDDDFRAVFDGLTDGKKRGLIHSVMRPKDLDRRIELALAALREPSLIGPPNRKKR